ncbi:MAG: thioesterase family protein [Pseudomonadota bacterium]
MSADRKPVPQRNEFGHFHDIPTRWMDNDVYGHVNNVVYYSYFDTLINRYLIDEGGLDFQGGNIIGIAVETTCRFHKSFAYPETVEAGLAIGHLGNSSVRYEIGLFASGEQEARADGHFVHVFVERETNRPVPIPDRMRSALQRLVRSDKA